KDARFVDAKGIPTTCTLDKYTFSLCHGRYISDELLMTPVGSSPSEHVLEDAHAEPPYATSSFAVTGTTHPRFCQADPNSDCTLASLRADSQVDHSETKYGPDHPWHRVSLVKEACLATPGSPLFACKVSSNLFNRTRQGVALAPGEPFSLTNGADRATFQ